MTTTLSTGAAHSGALFGHVCARAARLLTAACMQSPRIRGRLSSCPCPVVGEGQLSRAAFRASMTYLPHRLRCTRRANIPSGHGSHLASWAFAVLRVAASPCCCLAAVCGTRQHQTLYATLISRRTRVAKAASRQISPSAYALKPQPNFRVGLLRRLKARTLPSRSLDRLVLR